MSKFDPRIKLTAVILTTSLALVFSNPIWMVGLVFFAIILCVLFGADYMTFFNRLKRFVPLLIGISFIQIVFIRTGTVLLYINDFGLIYADGLFRGINMALRFLVIICSAAIMAGENSRRVIASLTCMGLPYTFSFMIMITLRFIPVFSESFSDAMTSIQLRGIELKEVNIGNKIKLYGHLMLPVVADAITKSQDLSTAMEARGFGALKKRTSYIKVKMKAYDYVAIFVLCAFAASSVWAYTVFM